MKFWKSAALACWFGAIGCFAVGWFADKPNVMSATAPLVVCYVIAAARARREQHNLP